LTQTLAEPWIVAGIFASIVAFAALKLVWGVSQWSQKPQHRIGERWGDERVEVTEWRGEEGYVSAGGELWRATSKDALRPGDRVYVRKATGLTLEVRKG
jgi:membrane protein implicated in regulation of membrane protease activity